MANFCDDKEQLYEAKELHFWLRPEAYGGYLHSFLCVTMLLSVF